MAAPRWLRRLGISLLIGGQAVSAIARGRINTNDLMQELLEAGPGSFLIVLITGLAAGTVFNIQVAAELSKQGANAAIGGLLALGLSREIAPLLTATLLTGKVATAYAAQLGTMKVTEQIDAITMLRTDPVEYLVVPRVLAVLLGGAVVGPMEQHPALQRAAGGVLELGAHLDGSGGSALDAAQGGGIRPADLHARLRLGAHHPRWPQGGGHQHHRRRGDDPGNGGPSGCGAHQDPVRLRPPATVGEWGIACARLDSATPTPPAADEGLTLEPRFGVPIGVVLLGAACLALLPLWGGARWLALVVALFGLFLALQTAQLRLQFADAELVVRRNTSVIRRFPYAAWLGWRLFWPAVPVLFFFREERSIHLLPMLFDARALRERLEHHLAPLGPGAPSSPL